MTSLLPLAQYHMDNNDHMDGAWHWGMGALMFLALIAVIVLVVWLVRSTTHHHPHHAAAAPGGPGGASVTETPAQILDRRLAEGDITPEDYQARAAILGAQER